MANHFGHTVFHLGVECSPIDRRAGDHLENILEHLGWANQTADMGGQNAVSAALHRTGLLLRTG
jgi:hypothetical protein